MNGKLFYLTKNNKVVEIRRKITIQGQTRYIADRKGMIANLTAQEFTFTPVGFNLTMIE